MARYSMWVSLRESIDNHPDSKPRLWRFFDNPRTAQRYASLIRRGHVMGPGYGAKASHVGNTAWVEVWREVVTEPLFDLPEEEA